MYAIEITSTETASTDEPAYWQGGRGFSVFSEDAVLFPDEIRAGETVELLVSLGFASDMRVVEFEDET